MIYYVYFLIDSRTGKIFYVGKGCKRRMYNHVNEVQRGRIPNGSNIYLGRKIKKILDSGYKIKYKKIFITENETEAYNKEVELIAEIGLKNLCNLTEGGDSPPSWKGRNLSSKHKRKISIANKGKNNPFYGKKHSEKTKKKILKSRIWYNHSDESKRKISESLMGHKYTDETKRKISKSLMGHKHSKETKKKMSEIKRGKNHPFYGKRHSEETKRKISVSMKNKFLN